MPKCPYYPGVRIKRVSVERGSTVVVIRENEDVKGTSNVVFALPDANDQSLLIWNTQNY